MTFEELAQNLRHIILDCKSEVCNCALEEGILFLFPPPAAPKKGTVFAGSVSDWDAALKNGLVHDGCTYLICRGKEKQKKLIPTEKRVNLLFLNAALETVLVLLSDILSGKASVQQSALAQIYQKF